jgi:enterochelin esterase-like enzyme
MVIHRHSIAILLAACAAPALFGCADTRVDRLHYEEIASRNEGRNLRYAVYEPPGWDRRAPLPLVVMLGGAGNDGKSADPKAVTDRLDRAITQGRLPPLLMVMLDGDSGPWTDWYDGGRGSRSWVVDEIIPAVWKSHPVVGGPAGLHILGTSTGGSGALQIWLWDPVRFGSATIISAPISAATGTRIFRGPDMTPELMARVFGPAGSAKDSDPFTRLVSSESLHGSRLLFGTAEHDPGAVIDSNVAFAAHLTQARVPHRYVRFAGGDTWKAWAPMIEYALCQQLQPKCPMPDPKGWDVRTVN